MKELSGTTHQELFSLARVRVANWLVLAVLACGALFFFTPPVAVSVLVGGVLANLSFDLLRRDLTRVLSGPLDSAKARFLMKYYVRLALLAALLFVLVKFRVVHPMGLLVGLSSVLLSICITVLDAARRMYFTAKEAS